MGLALFTYLPKTPPSIHLRACAHTQPHLGAEEQGTALGRRPPEEHSAPGGVRAQGCAPAPTLAPISSFSPVLFLTQPPAPRLSAGEEVAQSPGSCKCSVSIITHRAQRTTHRALTPTGLPSASPLLTPLSPGSKLPVRQAWGFTGSCTQRQRHRGGRLLGGVQA